MTTIELIIHLERVDPWKWPDTHPDNRVVWWAESPQLPGFTAAGDTLAEMREHAAEAISDLCGCVRVVERLVCTRPGPISVAVNTCRVVIP